MNDVRTEDLFRRQALDSLAEKPFGRPICLMPRPWSWLTGLIVTIFLLTALFVTTAEYTRTETVRGWLVAKPGVVRVAHSAGAQVIQVLHQAGDRVKKGEPLVLLSTDSLLANGSSKNGEVLADIRAALDELEQQQDLLAQREEPDAQSLRRQLQAIGLEEELLKEEIGAAQERVELGLEKQGKLAGLQKAGAATQWDVLRQNDEVGAIRQSLNQLRQHQAALRREGERLSRRLAALPVEVQATLSALRSEAFRLSKELAEYESRRSFVTVSPIDGTVASVTAQAGSATGPRQTLVTLLPTDWQLAAELFVPSRAAGFLHRGQPVRLNYDAFPRQKFGVFAGRINQVSDFVLLPAELPQTFSIQEATYKVRVDVQRNSIAAGAWNANLRPGMLLAAEIVLEKRSLVDWLLEPLRFGRDDSA